MDIHTLEGYIQNIYLVEQTNGLFLLDGCSRADVDNVIKYISDNLKRPLSDLKLIVVTHMHPDHAGGAHKLRKRTGAQIVSHPKARKWYAGPVGRTAHVIDIVLAWWVAGRIGKPKKSLWFNPILTPDMVLLHEQRLPGFTDWQVLFTPGHTDHDISLMHTPTKSIYIADLFVTVKRQLAPPYPVCHPNQYKSSLNYLRSLCPNAVYSAHVKPLAGSDIDYDAILAQAPKLPKNVWHTTKNRLTSHLGLQSKSH